jgi:ligand-binding SRPBCC domain-containing protein
MGKLLNEIVINAPAQKVWGIVATVGLLGEYDPTVKKSTQISANSTGPGAKRKVDMLDGKNWFEEEITLYQPKQALAYQLTACSFPISSLKHSYSFVEHGGQTIVKQVMVYRVKFGLLGKLLDALAIKKQFGSGIKKFFAGLKAYAEKN